MKKRSSCLPWVAAGLVWLIVIILVLTLMYWMK